MKFFMNYGFFLTQGKVRNQQFIETPEGHVWFGNQEGVTDVISDMQEWYQAGLLDPDYYTKSIHDYRNSFFAGIQAATYDSGNTETMQLYVDSYEKTFPDRDGVEDIGMVVLTADDGSIYSDDSLNYWCTTIFAPETEDATFERILDVMDGNVTIINQVDYPSQDAFFMMGVCSDEFGLSGIGDTIDPRLIENLYSRYELREGGTIWPLDTAYEFNLSKAKSNYSLSTDDAITSIVVEGGDVESKWKEFVESNRNIWEPLQEELNAGN